ncbi:MAG: hypothetical protein GF401_17170 [Chitinivibrionales bacterium]|nr:hypothetical protein [Chitinivibrionales bacterium]
MAIQGIDSSSVTPNQPPCAPCDGSDAEKAAVESGGAEALSDEERREVRELQTRDREVRAHEAAHVAAGGQYVRGGASYEYQVGPDGKQYAVGGEVSIDTSPIAGNPQATIQKMQVVRKAALAPAQPSGQDRSVAAQATQNEAKARQELAQQQGKKGTGPHNNNDIPESVSSTPDNPASGYTNTGTQKSGERAFSPPLFDLTV